MFEKRITLFKLFGFEVRLDMSWIFIAILVTWSLGSGYFPYRYPGFSTLTYWLMGAVGALGLFSSIIFHELCHSLVARSYGLPMKGITLFVFGGVAEMGDEPSSPKVEFLMSVVGPLSSFAIGFVFYGLFIMGERGAWAIQVNAVLGYLAAINILLACFNLIPAFPLDGGRILRSILWRVKNDIRWATRISSLIGSVFGYLLIAFAVYNLLSGNLLGAIWWFLIGMFIHSAAQMSYRQLLVRRALEGEPVSRFMKRDPVTVSPVVSLREFVDDYQLRFHFKMYPVVDDEILVGCITSGEVKKVPKENWRETTVGEVAIRVCAENSVGPETDSVEALALMRRTGNSRLMITEGGKLVGILSLKDLLEFLSLKVELED